MLLFCDEIQTGMGRTGKLLACMHDDVKPDGVMIGKALGGGLLPISAFVARKDVMDVFKAGDHGSTFGGNPLAATVGLAALDVLLEENLIEQSEKLGKYMLELASGFNHRSVTEVRGKGLFVGLEINPGIASAREVCLRLLKDGVLSKETHETVVRLAPPLVINEAQIESCIECVKHSLDAMED